MQNWVWRRFSLRPYIAIFFINQRVHQGGWRWERASDWRAASAVDPIQAWILSQNSLWLVVCCKKTNLDEAQLNLKLKHSCWNHCFRLISLLISSSLVTSPGQVPQPTCFRKWFLNSGRDPVLCLAWGLQGALMILTLLKMSVCSMCCYLKLKSPKKALYIVKSAYFTDSRCRLCVVACDSYI